MTATLPVSATPEDWTDRLLSQGYCIIPNALPPETIKALDRDLDPVFEATPLCQGRFYGERTKRFGSLLKRSRYASALVLHPGILAMVERVLGQACERIQLNVAQAIEIHPGEVRQLPHRDHDMWQGQKGAHEYLINVIWPLTPFTRENGATLIYPNSHGATGLAREHLGDPIGAACGPGAAICFLGSTAHGAGANMTGQPRRGVVIGYSLGWLKPYENQWLAYPPEIARAFPADLAALVGYAQHRPNLGNYEGQCPSILLQNEVPAHIGAIDALRPDQEAMLASFDDMQQA
ncbi:ectoine hydroxylase-related dioxygenase (phytanoyl-CoA dioxygenase family) [Sphingobium sp. B11D3B]|uniref:phytanoyl-CoA dioxygenase family protein n=1 Tax=Sphingobium sp. B11D3B TaxID=2940575 RepID=UPI0022260D99|nr:phytanoyl-CoA dioxygenase family protein [Sphingobium sp. B11D3B]MCW2387206.1 ectoine hydroxylase-related dioxygenase (phytanoyl-CoA dioxygenase family) [Sphingobium sp. B11D3B]